MRESLFSPLWHRFAQQRPQLRSHVTVQQQQYRQQTWYLLTNTTNGSHHRINQIAYQFVGRCDGSHSVQAVWDSLLEILGDDAPTQDEIIRLLTELDQRDLLRYEVLPNIPGMFRRKKEKAKQQRRAAINPLAMRLPIWDPTPLLERAGWLESLMFNPLTFLLWLVAVVVAALAAAAHWDELATHFNAYMGTPRYLLLAWVSFPLIKVLHELGHALAVRNWGGQVQEFGVTLFLLTPAPYVDASASSAFRRPVQRVIVGATGMMVELLLAAIALLVWFSVQPGLVHDLAFVTLFICGVSTLLFNGNPLLRFDAYYILCDTFDLPNLATRSRTYWINQLKKLVLGARAVVPLATAPGESKWLLAYAPLSFFYMLGIMSYVVLWLGSQSFLIGMLGVLFVVVMLVFKPLFVLGQEIFAAAPIGAARVRAKLLVVSAVAAAVAVLLLLPVPFVTMAQGVIWLPDEARIRPETEGFIQEVRVHHGDPVEPGQVLMVLEDPALVAEHEKLSKQLEGLRTEQFYAVFKDASRAIVIAEKMEKVSAELARQEELLADLQVRSRARGRLVLPHEHDLPGTFVKKGVQLGYVLDPTEIKVRVAVPEPDAGLVREQLRSVQVRTADHPDEALVARVNSDTNTVPRELPSAAMGDKNGGKYPTDPEDKEGLNTTEPVVLMDVIVPATVLERVGVRAAVRFEHGSEPLAAQAYRRLRQLFLRYFATSS